MHLSQENVFMKMPTPFPTTLKGHVMKDRVGTKNPFQFSNYKYEIITKTPTGHKAHQSSGL